MVMMEMMVCGGDNSDNSDGRGGDGCSNLTIFKEDINLINGNS